MTRGYCGTGLLALLHLIFYVASVQSKEVTVCNCKLQTTYSCRCYCSLSNLKAFVYLNLFLYLYLMYN